MMKCRGSVTLSVMSTESPTAIVLCRDNNVPLQVFNLLNPGDLVRIIDGDDVGTVVANT